MGFRDLQSLAKPLCLVLSAAALNACTVLGPDYVEPKPDTQTQWTEIETPALESDPPADPYWWKSAFNDPVLNELIDTALEQNLDIRSAALRVLQARQTLAFATGNQYPQSQTIDGSAEKMRQNNNFDENYNLGFNLSWEADIWGRYTLAVRSAQAQLEASVSDYDGVMTTLLADIAQNYLTIRTLQERIAVAQANVVLQEKSLDIARVKYEGGLVSELDLDQAKTLLHNTRALVYGFEESLQITKNALAVQLGKTPQELDPVMLQPAPLPDLAPLVSIGMPQELLRRRPDLRSAERRLAAQSHQIGYSMNELYPQLTLGGSIGSTVETATGQEGSDFFKSSGFSWSGLISFNWNIFNYGRLKSNVRLQDALFQQLLVDYQNSVLQAQAEVENSIVSYLNTQSQASEYGQAADAAVRASNISQEQYQDGLVEFDTVINVLTSLRTQQDLLASTRGLVATNLVQVYRSLGGGWEVRGDASPDSLLPQATRDEMLQRTKYWEDNLP